MPARAIAIQAAGAVAAGARVGGAGDAYPDVPAEPASHGRFRLPLREAPRVHDFVSVGTPVIVY